MKLQFKILSILGMSILATASFSENTYADVEIGSCTCTCSGPNIDGPITVTFDLFDSDSGSCHDKITQPGYSCDQDGNTVNCTYTPYKDGGGTTFKQMNQALDLRDGVYGLH